MERLKRREDSVTLARDLAESHLDACYRTSSKELKNRRNRLGKVFGCEFTEWFLRNHEKNGILFIFYYIIP